MSHSDLQTEIFSFKMAAVSLWKLLSGWKNSRWLPLPWKPRYQNNGVGRRLLLLCNGTSSYSSTQFCPLDVSEMPWSNFMKMPCEVVLLRVDFSKWLPLPWKRPKYKQIEKHKNDHSRLLAKQKLMKLYRKNIHI